MSTNAALKAANFNEMDTIDDDVKIENEQILYKNSILGKIETKEHKSADAKIRMVNVLIYSKKGKLVAEYNLEMLNKPKKNEDIILSANIKTTKDKVNHNGSNFIDFHEKQTEKDKNLQLDRVVKYLMDYKYL